jgi:hypothetical protein
MLRLKLSAAVNQAIARFNGTTGDLLLDSNAILSDDGSINIPAGAFYKINGIPIIGNPTVPTDNILDWDAGNSWYAPYAAKADGKFDRGIVDPTNITRLNYDGILYATKFYSQYLYAGGTNYLYLVPGLSGGTGSISLGDGTGNYNNYTIFPQSAIADVSITIEQKGTANLVLGNFTGNTNLNGNIVYIQSNLIYPGKVGGNTVIKCLPNVLGSDGYSFTLEGSEAVYAGAHNGGSLYLYGGKPAGAGTFGGIYLGTGSAGTNPLSGTGTGTSVILFNRTTGQVTYGDMTAGVTPVDGIFDWSSDKYQPYAANADGKFSTEVATPTNVTRLNYDGYFYATRLYDGATRVSVEGHTHSYGPVPVDDILDWSSDKYTPYTVNAGGKFATEVAAPASTNRLNYNGYFYATKFYASTDITAGSATYYTLIQSDYFQIVSNSVERLKFDPKVADSAGNVAHLFGTHNVLGAGTRLLSVYNQNTEKLNIDYLGNINLKDTGRVTQKKIISLDALGRGSSAPALVRLGNYAGYEFDISDDSYFSFEPPEAWDSSTALILKIYWYIDEAYATRSGEVNWQSLYSCVPDDMSEALDAPTHSGTLTTGDINIPATAKTLRSDSFTIPAAHITIDDVIGIHFSRIALVGGTNPTAKPTIIRLELYYTANKIGKAL